MAFGDPDASTPAFVKANSSSKAVTTASFTPPAGATLVACVVHDTAGGNLSNTSATTSSDGASGTGVTGAGWQREATHSKQDDGSGANNGHIAVSTAIATGVPMTVTTTGTNTNNPAGLYVLVFTGGDTTTRIDVIGEGHNTNAVVSQAITVATNGARGYLVASDWNLAANMTAGSGQTAVVADGIGAPDMRFYVGRQNAVSAPGSVTMSTGSPSTGNQNNWIAFALRPASGGASHSADASLAVTASFGSTSTVDKPASASLALTASLSAADTKDVPVAASLAVVASASTTAVPSRIGAAALAVTATLSAAAVGARPAAASLSVAVTLSTSTVDTETGAASLALTVALSASMAGGMLAPTERGAIVALDVAASPIGAGDRAAGYVTGATRGGMVGATEKAGVIHGV